MRHLPFYHVKPHAGNGWHVLRRTQAGPPDGVVASFPTRNEARIAAKTFNEWCGDAKESVIAEMLQHTDHGGGP